MSSAPETVEFLGALTRHGGDGEELWGKFAVPQAEIPKMQRLLTWGKCLLAVTVVKEDAPHA